jgi:hypothetical protein
LVVINIPSIDETDERFLVDAYLLARWRDPRLKHPPRPDGLPARYAPDQIWHPYPEIVNAVHPRERQDIALGADADGTVNYLERFDAEISSKFLLRSFPFDSQTLQIVIHPFAGNLKTVVFDLDRTGSWISAKFNSYSSLAEWEVVGMSSALGTASVAGRKLSEARFEIRIKRHYQYYLWKVFLPLFLMVMLSWTIFWMETFDLQNQIQVAVITLLTVIAFALAISSSLPKVPYLTFSDAFFLTCYIFVFVAILEAMVVHVTHRIRGEDPGLMIRKISRWLVPVAFCLTIAAISFRFLT